MAKVIINFCDKCNKQTDDLHEVIVDTQKERVVKELCDTCLAQYDKKLQKIAEWIKKEEF